MAYSLVSVIMPIRNEQATIAQSLGAVLAQDYPPERMEILIADGMSDDGTLTIIQALPDGQRAQVIPNPQRRQAAGLNLALKIAHGEIIVRVDGHTVIAPSYVRRCVELLQDTGAANVGGRMTPKGLTPFGSAIAAATTSPFGVPSAFRVSDRQQITDTVYMGAWPRRILEQVGGFSEQAGNEDYELNVRIRQAGGVIILSPLIRSFYICRQSLRELIQQYFAYGNWKILTLRRHPRSLRLRQLAAPLLVIALAGGAILGFVSAPIALLTAGLALAYLAADIGFSWRASRRTEAKFWRLLIVFPVIHLAWGFGFIAGLLATAVQKAPAEASPSAPR